MIKSFLKRYQKHHLRSQAGGFTLLELLVAMIVGSLISAGLLFIVVQLIETNLRESARSDTQRDLQAAIDYIARDVREAVFVYDAECLLDRPASPNNTRCPGLRSYLPETIAGTSGFGTTNNVPVLAFWRVDPLPDELKADCTRNSAAYSSTSALPAAIQNVPCLSERMYTLVVYSLNRETTGSVNRGRARIVRYHLPQFTGSSVRTTGSPEQITGWVNPRGRTAGKETSFLAWPVERASLTQTALISLQSSRPVRNNTNTLPLTDFVDWLGLYNSSDSSGRGRAPDRSAEGLILTPRSGASAAADPPRGFYVYVRGGDREGDLNQEVIIRIQGDAAGRPGVPDIGAANRPRVPIALETRVLTRGVTNKTQ
ncbi:prepilin-type N-terminal cleavage/methylation domain-containing protein [Cyanobacteria bacterium FACHB-63]|nr:prepilin-type N-terminal cleavage/methylation domain-containing protein [Cyanobacteria bacterium FACHB-63]